LIVNKQSTTKKPQSTTKKQKCGWMRLIILSLSIN